MTHPFEPVLVIGNGPVGQSAALLLAAWQVPVILLDARPARDPIGSKALCQQRDVLDIWAHVGAGEQVAAEGLTWTRARTFYRDTELFCQGFRDQGRSPFPPFVNISQTRTEQILDERIAANPLIDVRWGHRVVGIGQEATGVRLDVAVDVQTDPSATDRFVTVTGSYAIACPGARGDRLREMLGLTFEGRTFSDQFLICDIRTDLPGWEQERRFYFDPAWNPGRQVLIHPCPDSTYRIDWQVPPEYDLAAEEASGALDERIRAVIGQRDYEIVWKSQYRFHARQVDRMRVGRVLVAGDAAHLVSPFGARGLNSGVPDAENAAWKIAFVLHGWADESLLDSYHDERHAAAAENIAVTSATMRFLVPQDEAQWRERREVLEAAAQAADDSARVGADADAADAIGRVDSGRLAEPFWYVDSPLTTRCPWRPFGGRPPKGAAPTVTAGVLVPDVPVLGDGQVGRLREVARSGVSVLVCDAAEALAAREALGGVVPAGMPWSVHVIADLDPDGLVATALGSRPGEIWLLRPDAHIAAVLDDVRDLPAAVSRLLAQSVTSVAATA